LLSKTGGVHRAESLDQVKVMKAFSLTLLAVLLTTYLHGQQGRSCKGNPDLVGQCFTVHGRVRIVNGAGMVIWRIGTDRILRAEDEEIIIPDSLSKALSKPGDVYGRDIFGDFEVCPLTKSKPGEMQTVCVASASHLVIRENTH
jgi:hypothetical protein